MIVEARKVTNGFLLPMVDELTRFNKNELIKMEFVDNQIIEEDKGTDHAWAELAEKRYLELITGSVKPKSWEEIKKKVFIYRCCNA